MSGDLASGSTLAGYRVEELVGRGGMGVVYRAEQLRLGRMVALKVLAPELAVNEAFRERFERESRLAALIDHPSIIPIYEAGEADGLLFIAMRWVEGDDLGVLLKREGPLSLERSLHLLGQVGSALDAAHENGLVHRDVKPANVLVARGTGPASAEHAYLTDFGIAKMAAGGPVASVTRTGMFLGTPDYAAPEQFESRELDGRADQYALGCLLFQCLTGSRPFERTQEIAVMYAHLHDPPPRVSETRRDVPPALDAVVARALAKRREDRYRTCGELLEAANAACRSPGGATVAATAPTIAPTAAAASPGREEPARAEAATPPPVPPRAAAPPGPRDGERDGGRRRTRKRLWLALAAAGVIGVVVAVVIVLAVGGGEDSGPGVAAVDPGTTGQAVTTAPATTAPATTAPATTATTEAQTTAPVRSEGETEAAPLDLSALVWTPMAGESLGGGGGQEIAQVALSAGGGILATGSQGPARAHDVAFWTAAGAGQTVEKQVLEEPGDERAFGIAATPDGGAVAGGYRQAEPPAGDTDAAAWVLAGGQWQAASNGLSAPGYEKINRVGLGPGGEIVAVGTAGPGYGAGGVPLATDAAAWTSTDGGTSWSRADVQSLSLDGYQEMRGVTAHGDGLVTVGYDGKDAAVWLSEGGAWRQVDAQADLATAGGRSELDMRDVAGWDGGLLAVGDVRTQSGERNGAVWFSADGETWRLFEASAFGGSGDQQILGVVTGPAGIVAIGCSACDTGSSRAAVWTSTDGETWAKADEDQIAGATSPQQMNGVAAAEDSFVAGGWAQAGAGRDAVLWSTAAG